MPLVLYESNARSHAYFTWTVIAICRWHIECRTYALLPFEFLLLILPRTLQLILEGILIAHHRIGFARASLSINKYGSIDAIKR